MPIKRDVRVVTALVADAAPATIYTPGAGVTRATITAATFHCNNAATLELWLVPSGDSQTDTNKTTFKALATNETYEASEIIGQSIATGGDIFADTDVASSVNAIITVTEFTGDS